MSVACAENIRVMYPLLQAGKGGSIPTSALLLKIHEIDFDTAAKLNATWHSVLPEIDKGTGKRGMAVCYAAEFDNMIFAVAIWSSPVASAVDDGKTIELRRLAIAPDSPKNTASRMLAVMARLLAKRFPCVWRLVSYQAVSVHAGTIYKAAGWTDANYSKNPKWGTRKRRKRASGFRTAPSTRKPPQIVSDKIRWEKYLDERPTNVRKERSVLELPKVHRVQRTLEAVTGETQASEQDRGSGKNGA